EMYYDYRSHIKDIPSHNMLALRRAEKEEVVSFEIEADHDSLVGNIAAKSITTANKQLKELLTAAVKDGYERLMKLSLSAEVRIEKKREADLEAISTFERNLKELLLSPPAGLERTLAVDPGFRTGCKVVALDETGKFLEKYTIFPTEPQKDIVKSTEIIHKFIKAYDPKFIVVGNGTASRETESFLKTAVSSIPAAKRPHILLVSESGASIYSASEVASREFPDLDLTLRSAISIGRRFQDPLSELVKIDAKSIGVGQYQHDVDQTLLKKKLEDVTESCVNYVGVELNSASAELLAFVAGLNKAIAENIVKYRNQNGALKSRKDLLNVTRLGAKAFEQCAGFLRIRNGENPLDNSAVHPESYYIVQKMADTLSVPIEKLISDNTLVSRLKADDFTDEKTGRETVLDILEELKKPGRDPRATFSYAEFREDVTEISHLKEGMILEGSVTNVANF
ncbi:MAG: helix-hairpin-helix domain-containing protein, partial [Fibrobacteres bacterium]|nr:helix-hairpin-helix domain-containing protein [Fibrobacterota bacterium]